MRPTDDRHAFTTKTANGRVFIVYYKRFPNCTAVWGWPLESNSSATYLLPVIVEQLVAEQYTGDADGVVTLYSHFR